MKNGEGQARYVLPLFLSEFTETFATWENRFKINVSGTWKPLVDAYDASREDLFASNDKNACTSEDTQTHKCSSFSHSHVESRFNPPSLADVLPVEMWEA